MSVITKCDECGAMIKLPQSQFNRASEHFCSRQCHMKKMNRELNPLRMTDAVKDKLRAVRLGAGEGKTYTKYHGRHEHRVVAEQKLGRPLLSGEVVHHMDGNKKNNDPDNLVVFKSQSDHAAWHKLME